MLSDVHSVKDYTFWNVNKNLEWPTKEKVKECEWFKHVMFMLSSFFFCRSIMQLLQGFQICPKKE